MKHQIGDFNDIALACLLAGRGIRVGVDLLARTVTAEPDRYTRYRPALADDNLQAIHMAVGTLGLGACDHLAALCQDQVQPRRRGRAVQVAWQIAAVLW